MNVINTLVDEPKDILALFVGTFGTVAIVVAMFVLTDLRDILAGALIANVATVLQHFFGKSSSATS